MAIEIGRRQFISALGGAAAMWPHAAHAQQAAMPVVGLLYAGAPETSQDRVAAFRSGLGDIGFVEGQNVAIEYRWAQGQYDQLAVLAADLVRRQVTVIVPTGSAASALAAKAATTTIPIVFSIGADPIQFGLVTSLNRPGGNVTGVTFFGGSALEAKRLNLLDELLPQAATIAYLVNPTNPSGEGQTQEAETAARSLGRQIKVLRASTESEIEAAFSIIDEDRAGALLVAGDAFFASRRDQLALLATRHKIPTMYQLREYVVAGGLMSYGTSITDAYRQAGVYTGRILKGVKPGDLPVMQSTKFEFIINMKTAKSLGIKISDNLLSLADEVIE
jgi:putative tryptophan/tyrosine transport system substrate-binding protein